MLLTHAKTTAESPMTIPEITDSPNFVFPALAKGTQYSAVHRGLEYKATVKEKIIYLKHVRNTIHSTC